MAHWIRAIRQNGLTRSFWQLYFHTDMKAGTLVGTDRLGNNYYESSQEPWGTFCLWEITYHSLEKKPFCLFFENLLRSWQVGWVQKVLVGRRQPDPRWMVKLFKQCQKFLLQLHVLLFLKAHVASPDERRFSLKDQVRLPRVSGASQRKRHGHSRALRALLHHKVQVLLLGAQDHCPRIIASPLPSHHLSSLLCSIK